VEFFIPRALDSQGLSTEEAKFSKLAFTRGDTSRTVRVGQVVEDLGGLILVILRAADQSAYYVCTPSRGVMQGSPVVISSTALTVLAVEFR
jgi:hypothetical protein